MTRTPYDEPEVEVVEDDGPIDPPWCGYRPMEHARHLHRADPRNALREKKTDCWGRTYYADGSDYNLSEAQYAALEAKHANR